MTITTAVSQQQPTFRLVHFFCIYRQPNDDFHFLNVLLSLVHEIELSKLGTGKHQMFWFNQDCQVSCYKTVKIRRVVCMFLVWTKIHCRTTEYYMSTIRNNHLMFYLGQLCEKVQLILNVQMCLQGAYNTGL